MRRRRPRHRHAALDAPPPLRSGRSGGSVWRQGEPGPMPEGLQGLLSGRDFALVTANYPTKLRPGGEFVRSRVRAYEDAGLSGIVLVPCGSGGASYLDRGTPVVEVHHDEMQQVLGDLRRLSIPVLVHSPTPQLSAALAAEAGRQPIAVWYHGYEVRDYRRLSTNYSRADLVAHGRSLDGLNARRFETARPMFESPDIAVVFVSQFQKTMSEFDVGAEATNSHIIPNHIDNTIFAPRVRTADDARDILLLRSFSQRNYGNDIAVEALRQLGREPWFRELRVTIRGFGRLFDSVVAPLRELPNVVLQNRYSTIPEMMALHHDNGVMLCPTRYDTQGVVLGEAMASGMVTITNPVAAIPEYTDETCSLLPRPDDPRAFANAIRHLFHNPDLMPSYSRNAAERVAEQCGLAATIGRELDLIGSLS